MLEQRRCRRYILRICWFEVCDVHCAFQNLHRVELNSGLGGAVVSRRIIVTHPIKNNISGCWLLVAVDLSAAEGYA